MLTVDYRYYTKLTSVEKDLGIYKDAQVIQRRLQRDTKLCVIFFNFQLFQVFFSASCKIWESSQSFLSLGFGAHLMLAHLVFLWLNDGAFGPCSNRCARGEDYLSINLFKRKLGFTFG